LKDWTDCTNQTGNFEEFLLDLVQPVLQETPGREDRASVLVAVLAEDYVAAAEVLEVVGEGDQSPQYSIRIPSGLVLDSVTLDTSTTEEAFYVDG